MADSEDHSWRPTLLARVGLVAFGVGVALGGLWLVVVTSSEGEAVAGVALAVAAFWAPGAIALRAAIRLRISAAPDELTVVTLFSEKHLPWSAVKSAEAGYNGITILLRNGESVLSGAVQKSNAARWLGRRVRGDEVAEFITRRANGST